MAFLFFQLNLKDGPPDSNKITVDPVTCEITAKESLDYEAAKTHTIALKIVDTGFTPAKTAQTNLVITVSDENDNKPVSRGIFIFVTIEYSH